MRGAIELKRKQGSTSVRHELACVGHPSVNLVSLPDVLLDVHCVSLAPFTHGRHIRLLITIVIIGALPATARVQGAELVWINRACALTSSNCGMQTDGRHVVLGHGLFAEKGPPISTWGHRVANQHLEIVHHGLSFAEALLDAGDHNPVPMDWEPHV